MSDNPPRNPFYTRATTMPIAGDCAVIAIQVKGFPTARGVEQIRAVVDMLCENLLEELQRDETRSGGDAEAQ